MTEKKDTIDKKDTSGTTGTGRNPILGAIDTFLDRSREVIDPVKKVCYPIYETAKRPVARLSDPVKKICYEPFVVHYHKKYRSRYPKHHGKLFFVDMALLFVIGALVVTGIFAYFITPVIPRPVLITFDAELPSQPMSGEQTMFFLNYLNDSDTTIHCADMLIEAPQDFLVTGIDVPIAKTTEGCSASEMIQHDRLIALRLGELAPGARGRVALDGILYGPTGTSRTLLAEIRYWKEAGTEPTRVPLIDEITMAGSALDTTLAIPATVTRGQVIPVTITYTNASATTMPGVSIRLSAPEDFVITGSSPSRTSANEWRIGDLPPGTTGTVTAWGYLRTAYRRTHSATFAVRAYTNAGGGPVLTELVRVNADPRSSGFEVSQRIVSPSGRRHVYPGETVTVAVRYANTSDEALQGVRITLFGEPRFLAPSEGTTATWDTESHPELALVLPGASGELIASFPVTEAIRPEDIAAGDIAQVSFSTEAEAYRDDPTLPFFADSPADVLSIATKLNVKTAAVYYTPQGDQLGRGPIPLEAGQATKVWIFMQAGNGMNPVTDGILEATLPEGVTWTGRYSVSSGEALDYLPLTRTVRWNIGDIARFANVDGLSNGAQFELSVLPTDDDAGSPVTLLKDIRLHGMDTVTEVKLNTTHGDVDSSGLTDKDGKAVGIVAE